MVGCSEQDTLEARWVGDMQVKGASDNAVHRKGDARSRRSERVTVSAEEWGNKLHFKWYHVDSEQRPRGSPLTDDPGGRMIQAAARWRLYLRARPESVCERKGGAVASRAFAGGRRAGRYVWGMGK